MRNAGGIDKNIDGTTRSDVAESFGYGSLVGDIAGNAVGIFGNGFQVYGNNLSARCSEKSSNGAANAAGGSSDDCTLIVEAELGHVHLLQWASSEG
jgi:hypothetical protein